MDRKVLCSMEGRIMALNIHSNIPGIQANRNLLGASRRGQSALQKLSSGLRINSGKDGPAALIISELLRSQVGGFERAVRNTQEANNVLGIAEGGLNEISNQLFKMRELAVHSLNSGITSSSQTQANQAELNSAISTISRIAGTTSYSDQNLLDGSQGITFAAQDPDNLISVGESQIDAIADVPGQTASVNFSGDAADQAEKAVLETDFGSGATSFAQAQNFTITGELGTASFEFESGTSIEDAVDQINNRSSLTGVTAYAIQDQGSGATEIRLTSEGYGTSQTVQVEQEAGDAFAPAGETILDRGQNVTATVDGKEVEGDGLTLQVETETFSGTLQLTETAAQTDYDQDTMTDASTAVSAELGNLEGGMRFQLGEGAGAQNRDIFGVQSFDPANLGRTQVNGQTLTLSDLMGGGAASLANDPAAAIQVIDQAISDVATGRGRIGAYQANTLETNINSLQVAIENVTATESSIRDADMASEVSNSVREQILMKTGLMALQTANLNRENILKLLGG